MKYGMLVTLRPLPRDKYGGRRRTNLGTIAYHYGGGTGAKHEKVHRADGEPCVRLTTQAGLVYDYNYKVTMTNVIAVLKHEEIHHVLEMIGEVGASNQFDDIHRNYDDVCRILNCSNHQVSS